MCPALRDFGDDTDKDTVGDLCERDSQPNSIRAYFDPFVALHERLVQGTVPWSATDDEIVPVRALLPSDVGITIPGIVLGTGWSIRTQTRSLKRWEGGEYFGIRVRDPDTGLIAAACIVACDDANTCQTTAATGNTYATGVEAPAAVPEVQLSMVRAYDPVGGKTTYGCVMLPLRTLKITTANPQPEGFTVEFLGSPNVHFKSVDILQ